VQAPADGTTAPFKITDYSRWQLGNLIVMVPSAFDKTISVTGLGPMASPNAMQRSSRYPGNSGRGGCTPKTDLIDPERRFTPSNDALQKGNSITVPAVASKDDVWESLVGVGSAGVAISHTHQLVAILAATTTATFRALAKPKIIPLVFMGAPIHR
jgi:hypothetical protein